MSGLQLKDFQEQVSDLLLRHRSLLDVLSKYQQSNSSVNRAIVKSITEYGCIEVNASKQNFSGKLTEGEARTMLQTHMSGQLCEQCSDIISSELGKNLFYTSAERCVWRALTSLLAHLDISSVYRSRRLVECSALLPCSARS